MTENPLASLGELTKPMTVLIEKVSDAVGGICKPWQIVRVAKAEAKAETIRAEPEIQITDVERRAFHRLIMEEAKKQSNIEDITQSALPHLEDDSSPQDMDDDWITNFFAKCRIVSDNDMQMLWSRVLAGEANSPGAFSRKTVNILADLDKSDAVLFMNLCGFSWAMGNVVPLVYQASDEIYNRHGIDFKSLSHLDSLGLIQFDDVSGFMRTKLPKKGTVLYFGRPVELTFLYDDEKRNQLELGSVLFTRAGEELARVCASKPVDGFFELVYDKWANVGLVPKRETEQSDRADG